LKFTLGSSIQDLSIKLTASAVIDAYHPDLKTREEYGLSAWTKNLSNHLVVDPYESIMSKVDIMDFYRACAIARSQCPGYESGLNDEKVFKEIHDYVKYNKQKLVAGLQDPILPKDTVLSVKLYFGDFLDLNHREKELFERLDYKGPKNKDGLTPWDLADAELATKVATLLGMNPGSVDVTNGGFIKINFVGVWPEPVVDVIAKVQKELIDYKIISPNLPKSEPAKPGFFEAKKPNLYEILPEYSTKEAIAVVDKLLAEKHLKVENPWWEAKP